MCYCGRPIEPERASLGLRCCVLCSNESKDLGFMCFEHKTAPFLVRCNSSNKESKRIAQRAFRRSR